ncbi:MAG: ATP-dependent zinc metalloprotease FtsH [Oscillospiraceae bacterium]|nr:ATP-dependent zinc metalloprotease FtsH [Oscillospiraceae bacterium]
MVLAVILLAYWFVSGSVSSEYSYSQVKSLFLQEKVERFTISDHTITLYLNDGSDSAVTGSIPGVDIFYEDVGELIEAQYDQGTLVSYDYGDGESASWWQYWAPALVVGVVVFLLAWMMMQRQAQAGGANQFGKARTVDGAKDSTVTFADVAGAEEEKAELEEIVDFLRNPKKFTALGAHIPKGVLLVGPPGTGKTLLAKAVAGEAGVKFLSISGSNFVELYVGVGASRVRDLFEQAKKSAPSIIFIDEIDAVGRQRGAGLGGGHDEREQTLNQLLVEMDGFSGNSGVIVMAATNRKDILDPALLRPGRFDRQVYVGLPDIRGREAILKVHARNKPLSEDVDLGRTARATGGFSGADLENLMNEAALLSARKDQPFIRQDDLHEAMLKVIAGPEKRSQVVTEYARKLTAYHEAGHAVAIHALPHHDPVHQITIVPRGGAGGMTISLPTDDHAFRSRSELFEDIVAGLGGRIAEELVLGDVSTGAYGDFQQVTRVARAMVTRYGMSDKVGTIVFDTGHDEVFIGRDMAQSKNYSEALAAVIDQEIKRIVDEAYARCKEILVRDMDKLEAVAQFLLENETMSADEFEAVYQTGEPA